MAHFTAYPVSSHKSKSVALFLCILFGWCGMHQVYVGKGDKFLIYLLTLGGVGILWFTDLLKIIFGFFTDSNGLRLLNW